VWVNVLKKEIVSTRYYAFEIAYLTLIAFETQTFSYKNRG